LPLQVARLHLQGRDEEAQKAFETEMAYNWDSLVQAQLAEWYFGQGRIDAALEAATGYLAIVPVPHPDALAFRAATVPQILLLAASCQEAMRDRPAAIKTLHRLLDNWTQADPDLLDLKEARLRLARLEPALSSR
jgi:tetratricopeptide (TPR) repeat protein